MLVRRTPNQVGRCPALPDEVTTIADTRPTPLRLEVDAVLFDLDGVLADSTAAVERVWREFAARNGLEPGPLLAGMHGRRMVEIVDDALPGLTEVERAAELEAIDEAERRNGALARAHRGALELVGSLPVGRWAVVTSGTRSVASTRLAAIGITPPDVFVTADDVEQGKPSPVPYLLAAESLGFESSRSLVVEDAPSGIQAARSAGCTVVAVTTSHRAEDLGSADHIVGDPADIRFVGATTGRDRLVLEIRARVHPTEA